MPGSSSASPPLGASPVLSPADLENAERTPLLQADNGGRSQSSLSSASPASPPLPWTETVRDTTTDIWLQGKGMILVLMSQFFGASMNCMTKELELNGRNGEGFQPFQILFARMSITVTASYLYMWYAKVPQPFGNRSTFPLLLCRAISGFIGVYGLYYSVQYLPLSEATVLTFLAPILSCYACSIFLPGEIFTSKQQLAGFVSLIGVVLIARPFAFLQPAADADPIQVKKEADQDHRVMAVIMGMIGVLGASSAYASIRMIGQRCHPLVSVTYFSLVTTVVSAIAIVVLPSIPLELPGNPLEWTLLIMLGVCGFLLQFLLTAGLSYVPPPPRVSKMPVLHQYHNGEGHDSKAEAEAPARSSSGTKATTMLYTQMLFALFYDSAVWGSTLSAVSWIGSGLIFCSAFYVATARGTPAPAHASESEENAGEDTR
ncbi:DMT family transporter [Aspergillus mulundensis]|uniref:EamA domain-containing protein n=1 Tax=Aspergillus mulundensis TaxID=1810919 RepID=A0A3D8RQ97_9EURO|nr:Uncharacterized protein DSM5745_06249 [Aspergillus mulundensis]RDW76257.1 Uncharacterized protein DSM5745_06249 [Aspergillus mulundensis]